MWIPVNIKNMRLELEFSSPFTNFVTLSITPTLRASLKHLEFLSYALSRI